MEDNGRLHYRQTGQGTALLLIHGLLMNGDMFEPILAHLAQEYHILVPDLRGFGQSGHLAPPYTIAQHARDLARLLQSLSISSAAVLGYSQGGGVAQQLALDYPALVSRLVLCCTFACNRLTFQEKLEGLLMPWLVRLFSPGQLARAAKGLTPAQVAQLEAMMASNRTARMVEATREVVRFDSRRRLGEIQSPTLVVAGANDTAVPFHHAQMLVQGIAGARLCLVENAGHEMIWTHPSELLAALKSFLSES